MGSGNYSAASPVASGVVIIAGIGVAIEVATGGGGTAAGTSCEFVWFDSSAASFTFWCPSPPFSIAISSFYILFSHKITSFHRFISILPH